MKITILGTGVVGQTIAAKLVERGHEVMVGTRSPKETMARTETSMYGLPPFSTWQQQNASVQLGSYQEAAQFGELVINATNGIGSLEALTEAGEENLNNKILMDIANPLDFSHGMPPTLSVNNTDSLGEQIQRTFPQVKVVKTLNTVTAGLMVNPGLVGNGEHSMFVSGDDSVAKAQVSEWLTSWFGWEDIVDLGDITSARAMEMYLPLWLRLWGVVGTNMFNIKVVK